MVDDAKQKPETESQPVKPIVIPDGGLGDGLPDWMQARPAWQRSSLGLSTAASRDSPGSAIPVPDTSVIDLSTILTSADLPEWLQAIAVRTEEPVSSGSEDGLRSEPVVESTSRPAVIHRSGSRGIDSGQRQETIGESAEVAEIAVRPASTQPWWASDRAMGVLMAAVLVTLILVVLRLTDVL